MGKDKTEYQGDKDMIFVEKYLQQHTATTPEDVVKFISQNNISRTDIECIIPEVKTMNPGWDATHFVIFYWAYPKNKE